MAGCFPGAWRVAASPKAATVPVSSRIILRYHFPVALRRATVLPDGASLPYCALPGALSGAFVAPLPVLPLFGVFFVL